MKFKLALTLCASFNMLGSSCNIWGKSSKLSAAASNAQIREGLESILSISLLQRLGIGRLTPLPLPNKTELVVIDVCANNNVASWSTWNVNSSVYNSITCTRHTQFEEKEKEKHQYAMFIHHVNLLKTLEFNLVNDFFSMLFFNPSMLVLFTKYKTANSLKSLEIISKQLF